MTFTLVWALMMAALSCLNLIVGETMAAGFTSTAAVQFYTIYLVERLHKRLDGGFTARVVSKPVDEAGDA